MTKKQLEGATKVIRATQEYDMHGDLKKFAAVKFCFSFDWSRLRGFAFFSAGVCVSIFVISGITYQIPALAAAGMAIFLYGIIIELDNLG